VPGLFERVGVWRAAVIGVRVLAAAALILGIGRGLPVAFVDLDLRYSLPLPPGVIELIDWWDMVGEQQASAVVLAAAAAAVAGTAYRRGILDGASLALVALAWAFAFLPEGVVFAGMRSPAMDGVLVVCPGGPVAGAAYGADRARRRSSSSRTGPAPAWAASRRARTRRTRFSGSGSPAATAWVSAWVSSAQAWSTSPCSA